MKLMRYYFTSGSLDELDAFEEELEHKGIVTEQMHVLSGDDLGVARHPHLHSVASFMKADVVHSALIAAVFGVGLAALVMLLAYLAGWGSSPAGWMPLMFLALVILGFVTWQGGLWGIQTRNARFRRFDKEMREGRHVFLVDAAARDESVVKKIAAGHGSLRFAGVERGAPAWLVFSRHHLTHFFTHTFP